MSKQKQVGKNEKKCKTSIVKKSAKRLLFSLPKPEKREMSTVEYVISFIG